LGNLIFFSVFSLIIISVARQLASVWARAGMREEATRLMASCEKNGSGVDPENRAKVLAFYLYVVPLFFGLFVPSCSFCELTY